MDKQRRRRAGKQVGLTTLSDEQIRKLDEIDFPWEAKRQDSRWYAMYDELRRFQKKYGHCQPSPAHGYLYKWSLAQRLYCRQGSLSSEKIKELDQLGFPWETKRRQWSQMVTELSKYYTTHNHVQVNQDDDPELFAWIDIQRKRYHFKHKKTMLSDAKIEQLEGFHFCWSLDWRDRTWHGMYTEAAEFFKEHSHVRVTKKENPSLHNWVQMQEKRYKKLKGQKPLSEEELEMMEQIDFPFLAGQPRMAWNAMYAKLERYRKENKSQFPTSHKDDPDLNRWMRQQRHRLRCAYGYPSLLEEQTAMLETISFPRYPKMEGLV